MTARKKTVASVDVSAEAPVAKPKRSAAPKATAAKSRAAGKNAAAESVEVADTSVAAETVSAAPVPAAPRKPSDVERILLPANMEMSGLDASFSILRAKFPPTYKKCILDGADINVIDASGIQLLINFVSSVKQKGCQVEWENYSLPAYQLANELGVVEQLGD